MTKMAPAAADRSTTTPATIEERETIVASDFADVAGVVEIVTTWAVVVVGVVVLQNVRYSFTSGTSEPSFGSE
jgi:hypothetical protein